MHTFLFLCMCIYIYIYIYIYTRIWKRGNDVRVSVLRDEAQMRQTNNLCNEALFNTMYGHRQNTPGKKKKKIKKKIKEKAKNKSSLLW